MKDKTKSKMRSERPSEMRADTIAIHSGYDIDPTTKAVAVPIYQTVAYAFDSAEHGAACSISRPRVSLHRSNNPTNAVLERAGGRARRGDRGSLRELGQAALNYAALNVTALGAISFPCRSSTARRIPFRTCTPNQGVQVRFAGRTSPTRSHG